MRRKTSVLVAVATLLLLVVASAVYAQDRGGSGDKFVFGGNYVLESGEMLNGSLAVLGGSAELAPGSTVNGDVFVAGGRLSVAGTIHGSVAVFGGAAVLADSAVVMGDFAMFGGALERAPGAAIRGETFSGLSADGASSEAPETPATPDRPQPFGGLRQMIAWEIAAVSSALMLIVLGIIAVVVAPKAVGRIASAAASQPALSFGAGLLTVVVGILGGLLLLIACCLGVLVWLALAAAMLLGWIGVGVWLGQRILAALKIRHASALPEVALGILVITLVANLPWCIGFLFTAIVGSIGLGAVVLTRFGRQPLVDVGRTLSSAPMPLAPLSLAELDAEVLAPLPAAPEPPSATAPAPQAEPTDLPVSDASASRPEPVEDAPADPKAGG